MRNFSTIAPQLQVKIAEKIDYIDQREFELSSKHGKQLVKLQRHEPVVELTVSLCDTVSRFMAIKRNTCQLFRWHQIQKMPTIPRFLLTNVRLFKDAYLNNELSEFCETVDFVQKKELHLFFNSEPPTEMHWNKFFKVLNITHVHLSWPEILFPETLSVIHKLSTVEMVFIQMSSIPKEEHLQQLKCTKILFNYTRSELLIDSTINFILKEWLENRRNIDWFKVLSLNDSPSFDENILFMALSYSIIWKHKKTQRLEEVLLKRSEDSEGPYFLNENDFIVSIDRGDKKLMVFVSFPFSFVLSQEYIDLKDVIEIRERK